MQKRSSADMSNFPENALDLQSPDEARSPKRTRLEAPLAVTEDTQQEMMDEDDWDDIYGDVPSSNPATHKSSEQSATPVITSIPSTAEGSMSATARTPREHQSGKIAEPRETGEEDDGVPTEAIVVDGDDLVAPPPQISESSDKASANVMQETTEVEHPPPLAPQEEMQDVVGGAARDHEQPVARSPAAALRDLAMVDTETSQAPLKVTEDPEFMAAAAAQKENKVAEWQFDSSDAESSSDSDSSDSSDDSDDSDDGSEGGYEMLDPATMAKILMSGDGEDDEGGKGKGKGASDHQPRTANEVKDTIVPKPDVVVTPEMKITHLGNVESVVENMILIKGATPGEYQVLEGGSVLCNEKREVIGAVADTFGRVQEPLYSVSFNSGEEIVQAGLTFGTKVFYVDNHSTFVFTQPLKNMKGTDASNIHDEEVGEDELEFSDDETEAEFKRQKKLAKKSGRGGLSRSAFQSGERVPESSGHGSREPYIHANASDVPAQTYGGALSYDDDEPTEDFYQPLKRPDNLSQMMAGGPPVPRQAPQSFDRGRGRGRGDRGRGRGDRGRGRGDRNQRGGRGGSHSHQQQDHAQRGGNSQRGNTHRGNAHSFPDRHNSHSDEGRPQHTLPPKPTNIPALAASPSAQTANLQGMPANQPQYQQQSPQTYQFGGYTFQYGNPAPQQQAPAPQYNNFPQQQAQQPPAGSMSAGAYVNPAFFQQQAQYQQQPSAYGAWNTQYQPQPQQSQQYAQPHPPAQAGAQQPPPQQQQSAQPPRDLDLTSILKRLGA